MKKLTTQKRSASGASLLVVLACAAFSPLSLAEDGTQFVDYAEVQDVRPIYRIVEHQVPQRSCWSEDVRVERPYQHSTANHSATSTLLGGVIGGAIGHAVGRGHDNKKIGTAVGTVLGMSIGHDVGHKNRTTSYRETGYENIERCETSYRRETEEQLIGYDVTYRYRGETFRSRTQRHPGERIKVAVSVNPIENY